MLVVFRYFLISLLQITVLLSMELAEQMLSSDITICIFRLNIWENVLSTSFKVLFCLLLRQHVWAKIYSFGHEQDGWFWLVVVHNKIDKMAPNGKWNNSSASNKTALRFLWDFTFMTMCWSWRLAADCIMTSCQHHVVVLLLSSLAMNHCEATQLAKERRRQGR